MFEMRVGFIMSYVNIDDLHHLFGLCFFFHPIHSNVAGAGIHDSHPISRGSVCLRGIVWFFAAGSLCIWITDIGPSVGAFSRQSITLT